MDKNIDKAIKSISEWINCRMELGFSDGIPEMLDALTNLIATKENYNLLTGHDQQETKSLSPETNTKIDAPQKKKDIDRKKMTITEIALDYYSGESVRFIEKLHAEDIDTAQKIIDILAETQLPICIVTDILDFCHYAIGFSRIERPGRI